MFFSCSYKSKFKVVSMCLFQSCESKTTNFVEWRNISRPKRASMCQPAQFKVVRPYHIYWRAKVQNNTPQTILQSIHSLPSAAARRLNPILGFLASALRSLVRSPPDRLFHYPLEASTVPHPPPISTLAPPVSSSPRRRRAKHSLSLRNHVVVLG